MRFPKPTSTTLALLAFAALATAQFANQAAAQSPPPADLSRAAADLEARVAKLEATSETNAQAIAQMSAQLAELNQRISALGAASGSSPELLGRVDANGLKVAELERELETLRTQLADLEQPYVAAGSGSSSGFTLESGDYSATVNGYFHARWQFLAPEDFATITDSGFRVRRARAGLKGRGGRIFDRQLTYKLLAEFASSVSLRDYYINLKVRPELNIRVGQAKLEHGRLFLIGSTKLLFTERSFVHDSYRYDRDIGVTAHGKLASGRATYSAAITNGAGPNAVNDNIDFALSARVQGAALGELIPYTSTDIVTSGEPRLTIGASVVHDLVRVPDIVGGVVVMERDVDADEIFDNVRVLSLAADATFRLRGLEAGLEAYFRRESWGTILDHSANEDVAALIRADENGNQTYVGGSAQASYLVWPDRVAVGGRLGYSQQTFLGVGGQSGGRALADRLFELGAVGQLYNNGTRLLGLDYALTNYNSSFGNDPAFDIEHRVIVETQLLF